MSLGVHVIGPGFGESIVIELPDGSCGVVDVYRPSDRRFPVHDFVTNHLKASSLAFLSVSHPHSDHCRGAAELAKKLSAGQCWVFDAIDQDGLREFFYQLHLHGSHDEVDRALGLPKSTISLEVLRLHNLVFDEPPGLKRRLLRAPASFSLCDGDVTVNVLTPGVEGSLNYKAAVNRAVRHLSRDGVTLESGRVESAVYPNLISGSIAIRYGNTSLMLLADAETPLWQEWQRESQGSMHIQPDPVQFIKVAHHGSSNGYCRSFYERMCSVNTIAVTTPFARNGNPLPSREGVERIGMHTQRIYCTNRFAATFASGLPWLVDEPGSLPVHWAEDIARQPALRELLAPEINGDASPQPGRRLPSRWVRNCRENPELLRLIHPDLLQTKVLFSKSKPEEAFRTTFYFDDSGNEIAGDRYIGPGAGRVGTNT